MMDYAQLLEHSFAVDKGNRDDASQSRLEYLSQNIFDFTTYDGEMDELFGRKAVEVCAAITNRTTFEYIEDSENYRWFLIMCHMPFFTPRLEWGTSIRGAWWDYRPVPLESCGLWNGDVQLVDGLQFSSDEWAEFMRAVVEFAAGEK
jgi:hypothetical protein